MPDNDERLPSGNISGLGVQNPGSREISRASEDVFSNTSLLSAVYGYNIPRVFVCDMIKNVFLLAGIGSANR